MPDLPARIRRPVRHVLPFQYISDYDPVNKRQGQGRGSHEIPKERPSEQMDKDVWNRLLSTTTTLRAIATTIQSLLDSAEQEKKWLDKHHVRL